MPGRYRNSSPSVHGKHASIVKKLRIGSSQSPQSRSSQRLFQQAEPVCELRDRLSNHPPRPRRTRPRRPGNVDCHLLFGAESQGRENRNLTGINVRKMLAQREFGRRCQGLPLGIPPGIPAECIKGGRGFQDVSRERRGQLPFLYSGPVHACPPFRGDSLPRAHHGLP